MDKDPLIGTLLAGRFRIEEQIGAGSMGTVYLARHTVLHRAFAIKVIRRDLVSGEDLARFRREARVASRVEHPNILSVFDFGHTKTGSAYLVMEYLEGQNLTQLLGQGPVPLLRLLRILMQVAEALSQAHAVGVVHRDLKPDNIVLAARRPEPDFVKVLDFGLAKIIGVPSTTQVTVDGRTLGTPLYMSPEQCSNREIDHRTDIYSFGVLAFELISGRVPFNGTVIDVVHGHLSVEPPVPSQVGERDDIPPQLDQLVRRCLAKDPAERFANTEALWQELQQIYRDAQRLGGSGEADEELITAVDPRRSPFAAESAPDLGEHIGSVSTTFERLLGVPTAKGQTRNLVELIGALREGGWGSPALSQALAKLIQADDPVFVLEARVAALEARVAEAQAVADERQARLRQGLGQLEFERHKLLVEMPAEQLTETLPEMEMAVAGEDTLEGLESDLLEVSEEIAAVDHQLGQELDGLHSELGVAQEALRLGREALAHREGRLLRMLDELRQQHDDFPRPLTQLFAAVGVS